MRAHTQKMHVRTHNVNSLIKNQTFHDFLECHFESYCKQSQQHNT